MRLGFKRKEDFSVKGILKNKVKSSTVGTFETHTIHRRKSAQNKNSQRLMFWKFIDLEF